MREIKFRGLRVDGGCWVYGYLVVNKPTQSYRIISNFALCQDANHTEDSLHHISGDIYLVHPESVCQFIGLKDKNGVEIYESDIVKVHVFVQELGENYGVQEGEREFVGLVTFDYMGLTVESNEYKDQIWMYEQFHEESLEVIGNIHENPDLL